MILDLIGAIGLTGAAALWVAVLSRWYGAQSPRLIYWHGGWFVVVATIGATGVLQAIGSLGTPALGVLVAAPMIGVGILVARSARIRAALGSIPTTVLIGLNAFRVEGVLFLVLYAEHRLPAPFAPNAGWGDIVAGVTALPVMWAVRRQVQGWRVIAFVWNLWGLLDLIDALFLGVTSAEGSPFRLFFGDPSTAAVTMLPWLLIPAYLVPEMIIAHIAIFRRLTRPTESLRPATIQSLSGG
jgi:hypothetical protein